MTYLAPPDGKKQESSRRWTQRFLSLLTVCRSLTGRLAVVHVELVRGDRPLVGRMTRKAVHNRCLFVQNTRSEDGKQPPSPVRRS